ncbi:MAG: inositol monophosphatase [Bacteroidia bacterium]|nr:inositol monophosphatase [Bacteroidia bacterium]
MNLKIICNTTIKLAKQVGQYIREAQKFLSPENIREKGMHDFVTEVDKSSEKMLVKGLHKILPEAGFITEEKTVAEQNTPFRWVIDPLDGTTNYIHRLRPYSISIGLLHYDQPVLGVIYEIGSDECFYAYKGGKAYMNGEQIKVSNTRLLKDSLIVTGFPVNKHHRLDPYLLVLKKIIINSHGVRRLGSAAADLAYVACGRFEAFYEYGLNPWDVAAGIVIVQQAGGKITDFNGGNNYLFGKELIASNNNIHDELTFIIYPLMNG